MLRPCLLVLRCRATCLGASLHCQGRKRVECPEVFMSAADGKPAADSEAQVTLARFSCMPRVCAPWHALCSRMRHAVMDRQTSPVLITCKCELFLQAHVHRTPFVSRRRIYCRIWYGKLQMPGVRQCAQTMPASLAMQGHMPGGFTTLSGA